ncbi:MAG: transglutaminase domain-containing protein [Bacteroidales bacterium]|nr:transglutaminase domain-containing protein [Bacteroidales bacterium]
MRHHLLPVLIAAATVLSACESHFINEPSVLEKAEAAIASRAAVLDMAGVDLSSMGLSPDEMEAMKFLYAYMPLGDIVNHSPEYFLGNYRVTKKAMKEMSWGSSVPERELRHFVLPLRANNESLDSSRFVFYDELAPRVRHLSMYDAVLEINHWCHEKANYMPSDRRTSAPLATIRTAYGRCGEESTLLVVALRAVGIPARQVYTPRWAHTDSNHAWVEAWVDGKWYFLGACEPEPVLNLGWFNAPASRGMLMHTNVFGHYDGPEEIVDVSPNYTEINVIQNYAPDAARLEVKVTDEDGTPIEGVRVQFKIYNYSEFTTVCSKSTDAQGRTSLTAGIGDMLVFASHQGRFGFSKVTFGSQKEVVLPLIYKEGDEIGHIEMDIVPPQEKAVIPEVTPEQRAENTRRFEYEDSLRNAYVATFYDDSRARAFASEHGLDPARTSEVMVASRGNYGEMEKFLSKASAAGMGERALELLSSVSQKDLRDTPASVLEDHLYATNMQADAAKVLSPRVDTELLTAYRRYLQENVPESLADSIRTDPALLVSWCRDNLSMMNEISQRYVTVAPSRVWDTRLADKASRDVFFVAMCRSMGVEAWMDSVTGVVKYSHDGRTYDVDFNIGQQLTPSQGCLRLNYSSIPLLNDPKYKSHFSLSKMDDMSFRSLNYKKDALWSDLFKVPAMVDAGYYMLVSGSRMSGGNVCADIGFFSVEEGRTTVADLVVRDDADQIRVIGSFDSEARYDKVARPSSGVSFIDVATAEETSVLTTTGRGYFTVIVADAGSEPTNHAMMDLAAAATELEEWGRAILVLFASEEDCAKFRADAYDLPSTVHFGRARDGRVRERRAYDMNLAGGGRLPLTVIADTFNRVVFFSQGYSVGLGNTIVRTAKAL